MKDNHNLEWEEIFANEDTHKKFISKIYKEPHTAQYQRHNNRRHKWAKHRNGCFLEEDIQIVIRHMKTCSASLILTQTQSKSNKVSPHTGQDGHLKTSTEIICLLHWQTGSLCPALCDPIDGSPPGSPTPGILQAKILEWVAISFSNA